MKWDFQNNRMSMTALLLITLLNVGIVTSFLNINMGTSGNGLNGNQIYVLAGLELAAVLVAYVVSRRSKYYRIFLE